LDLVQAQNDDQGEKEESNIPRKVLRKYRIRRPLIIDENGNAVTTPSVPRLRRIRVNKPQEQQSPAVPAPVVQQPAGNSLDTGNLYSYNFQQPQALIQRQVRQAYNKPHEMNYDLGSVSNPNERQAPALMGRGTRLAIFTCRNAFFPQQ